MRRAVQRNEGVALLELVTALVIVSVGLFGVVQMYHVGIGRIREMQHASLALRAIDNELETVRAMSAASLPVATGHPWFGETPELDSLNGATASMDVAPYGPAPALKQVTVRLAWQEGLRTVQREVTTLVGVLP